MQKLPKVVAVTGAAGYIGTRLLLQLESNMNVGRLVAFDKDPLPFPIHNISFHQEDITSGITQYLLRHQVETMVHLASAYSHTSTYQDWARESAEDIAILDSIQDACVAAGVKHAIFLSSHTVYGAFADNPIPLTESSPIRTRPGDFLGQASFNADSSMLEFREKYLGEGENQRIKVAILRTCPVLGYSDDHQRVERIFPYRFWGAGENPPYQFLHEVDMARLLEAVIQQEADGVYNVAGRGRCIPEGAIGRNPQEADPTAAAAGLSSGLDFVQEGPAQYRQLEPAHHPLSDNHGYRQAQAGPEFPV